MNRAISKSIIQWVFSFLLFDVLLGIYILFVCIANPDHCGESVIFVTGFFSGFLLNFVLPDIGSWHGLDMRAVIAPMLGVLMNFVLGVGIGYRLRHRAMRWSRTISIAVAASLAISFIPALLMSYIGLLKA